MGPTFLAFVSILILSLSLFLSPIHVLSLAQADQHQPQKPPQRAQQPPAKSTAKKPPTSKPQHPPPKPKPLPSPKPPSKRGPPLPPSKASPKHSPPLPPSKASPKLSPLLPAHHDPPKNLVKDPHAGVNAEKPPPHAGLHPPLQKDNTGKKVGVLFLGFAGSLQVAIVGFFGFKRWQISKIHEEEFVL